MLELYLDYSMVLASQSISLKTSQLRKADERSYEAGPRLTMPNYSTLVFESARTRNLRQLAPPEAQEWVNRLPQHLDALVLGHGTGTASVSVEAHAAPLVCCHKRTREYSPSVAQWYVLSVEGVERE